MQCREDKEIWRRKAGCMELTQEGEREITITCIHTQMEKGKKGKVSWSRQGYADQT